GFQDAFAIFVELGIGAACRVAGAQLCFASDWPVSPVDPLMSIKAAMIREKLHPSHPDQRQSLHQAVHGYTAGGAYAEFNEDCKGVLKTGAFADIVILDGNIETTDPGVIDEMKVTTTICGGDITYEA
ncbi:MAG: amidohydrolase family protein, partial [Pseudomonadota bacterium]